MHRFILSVLVFTAALAASAAAPDFSRYVEVSTEEVGPGRTAGVVRNISGGPVRNIVLRVRHRWQWPAIDGAKAGNVVETRTVEVADVILPGELKGFASVHDIAGRVPGHARYQADITVLELTTMGLAPE